MALAKKCDRCGKLYEHYPIGSIPEGFNAVRRVRNRVNGNAECEESAIEMCPECMAAFEKFMEELKSEDEKAIRKRR